MSITLEDLQEYNRAVKEQEEDEDAPAPVLLLDQYRVRLVAFSELPIVSNYSNFAQLGLPSDDVLVIDSAISSKLKEIVGVRTVEEQSNEEQMETGEEYDDKENDGGPLDTSLLTLDKLKRVAGTGEDVEVAGLDAQVEFFAANPIPKDSGISLHRYLRLNSSKHFSPPVNQLPVWICTSISSLPSECWLATGRTNKNVQFSGITRIVGHLNGEAETSVNLLNEACGGAQANRLRAVYDVIRKVQVPNRDTPGEVTIDIRWATKNNLVLLENPAASADCFLKIDLGWKDKRFFADESIFAQLFLLLNLADVLAYPEKEVEFSSAGLPYDDLVKEMNALIEACTNEENVFVSKAATTGEVTDLVWRIVSRCGDIKVVTLLLKQFLQALAYGKVKSHVLESNKSLLATLIRASKTNDFRMPILERLSTIDMMLEIGVESLTADIVEKFEGKLKFPKEELTLILKTCENDLKACAGNLNTRALALLPVAMAFATVNQVFGLLNEKDHVILPDLVRRVLTKYTSGLIEKSKKGDTETFYTFETTLPLLRINNGVWLNKQPRFWSCENVKMGGASVQTRMMTVLELESSLEHVNGVVNATRPVRETKDDEKPSAAEEKANYTVSHTVLSYFPKV